MTFFFLSASSLKRLKAVFSAAPSTWKPSSSSALRSAWRPECLPSTIELRLEPDRGGVHDLVGGALLEHAVLVDAGLVGERVAAHDRLVRLHLVAGQPRHQPARSARSRVVSTPVHRPSARLARVQQHHDLLERRVAGPLADAVDRALHLAAARLDAGEASWPRPGPRSSWQCTDVVTSRRPGTSRYSSRRTSPRTRPASCSPRCPGTLIVVAPSSSAIWITSAMNSTSEREPSSGENSTSSHVARAPARRPRGPGPSRPRAWSGACARCGCRWWR